MFEIKTLEYIESSAIDAIAQQQGLNLRWFNMPQVEGTDEVDTYFPFDISQERLNEINIELLDYIQCCDTTGMANWVFERYIIDLIRQFRPNAEYIFIKWNKWGV